MPRVNPCSLPRPKPLTESHTFTDPLHPGIEWPLTFEVQAGSDFDMLLGEKSDEYTELYVTGRAGGKPALLPPVGEKRVRMTRRLCTNIALLEMADVTPLEDGETKWGIDEWRGMSVTAPNAFDAVLVFVNSLYEQASSAPKKESADGA